MRGAWLGFYWQLIVGIPRMLMDLKSIEHSLVSSAVSSLARINFPETSEKICFCFRVFSTFFARVVGLSLTCVSTLPQIMKSWSKLSGLEMETRNYQKLLYSVEFFSPFQSLQYCCWRQCNSCKGAARLASVVHRNKGVDQLARGARFNRSCETIKV